MKFILFLIVFISLSEVVSAQYVYTIKADSVKLTNCDSSELIIENHTQGVPGFLFNTGNGRTIFKRGAVKLNDSFYLIGGDTLKMRSNSWVQGGNSFGATGVLGTLDNNHLDFYTNNSARGRLTNTGNLLLGTTVDNTGYKMQLMGANGGLYFNPNLSRPGDRFRFGGYLNLGDGQESVISASNDTGKTYTNILVARDGNIGLGQGASTGWYVSNPTLRINSAGIVSVASPYFYFGNTAGPYNSSCLVTYVSNINEWNTGLGNYPSGQNHYYFGTQLQGLETGNKRAPLWIGGDELHFFTGAASDVEAGRFSEAGNLLLGSTTDDGNKLQVNGTIKQAYNNTANFGNGLLFDIAPYNSVTTSRIYASGEISYQSNYTGDQHVFENSIGTSFKGTLVTLDPGAYNLLPDSQLTIKVLGRSGNLGLAVNMLGHTGIGTLYPSAQLHTTGTVRFAGLTSDTTKTRVLVSDASGNLYYRDASTLADNGLLSADLASGRAILPSLAINGTITAQRMKLSQAGWPDYVFGQGYHLPRLTEIEAYIQEHGHLPGIASAAEVEKNGIDVGNQQAALLKKTEELTLYAINQEKKLKAQEQAIGELQQQNKEVSVLKKEMAELRKLIGK